MLGMLAILPLSGKILEFLFLFELKQLEIEDLGCESSEKIHVR